MQIPWTQSPSRHIIIYWPLSRAFPYLIKLIHHNKQMTLAKEFVASQKEKLLSEKNLLEAELNKISTKDNNLEGNFDANFPDYGRSPEDNATEEEEYTSRVGIENSLELKLLNVNLALKNIEENKYGVCNKCGAELEQDRLAVMPSATRCVTCK